ncbi:hypothetical protein MVLG_01368 [Microbotryum lychnidis-dioicae p1A1 Lamole]|uniref:Transcriptional regulatory protein DEP1 n=1 Tax=Microbotryum lychnidis-dioicae (strain p1A1 Lamole / MvSl-1064) TaxID=683840 RepID=U5H1X2_USTV1|nr:hypothetical protein MVLG_01368 [Microbotryum lychnidis-dioicae p1A1 Lamole]|eukprot:KDE08327.1 hypothetical protein MVLG_01368 [Microbotryum lychnidis-dioicae p1A1 Lamole]
MDEDAEATPRAPRVNQPSQDTEGHDDDDEDQDRDGEDEAEVGEVNSEQHLLRNVSSSMTRDANASTSSAGSVLSDLNEQAQDERAEKNDEDDEIDVVMEPKYKAGGGRGRGARGARRGASKRGRGSGRGGRGGSSKVVRQDDGLAYESSSNEAMDVDLLDASTAHLDSEALLTPVPGEEGNSASQDIEPARKSTSMSGRGGRGKRGRGGRGGRGGAAAAAARARKRSSTEEEDPSQNALTPLDATSPNSTHSSLNNNPNKRRRESEEPEQEEVLLGALITDDAQAAEVLGGLLSGDALPPLPGADVEAEEEGVELDQERDGSEEVEGAEDAEDANEGVFSGTGEGGELHEEEEADTPGPTNDGTAMEVDGEEEAEDEGPEPEVEADEEVLESPKPRGVAGRKAISVKRSKRRTNGKSKHDEDDEDDEDRGSEAESAAVSEHEDEQVSDDAFMRKRAEAMEALTKIEIAFARLRDRLYVERMAEVERDRLAVDTGAHPELIHLTNLIELRRARKLELARNQFNSVYLGYEKQREMAEHKTWVWWADARAELRSTMLDEANSKRRRLEREKRNLDRPQDNTLLHALAPKITPVVPLHHRRRLGLDGETLSENDIAWALRHRDVQADPSVSGLEEDAALSDLERMGLRQPSKHSTAYAYDPIYGAPPGVAAYADPNTGAPMMSPYGYAALAYETALGVPSAQIYGAAMVAPPPQPAMTLNYSPSIAAPLPPLPTPRREASLPRPPSNPRSNPFPHEPDYQGVGRTSSYPGFGASNAEEDRTPWSSKTPASQFKLEENRRRAPSVPGTGGLGELSASVEIQRLRQSYDDASHSNSVPSSSGGSGANGYSLDDHMKYVRSPKTSTSSSTFSASANKLANQHHNNGMLSDVSASSSTHSTPNPNSQKRVTPFMSIPAIPPYNPHRHAAAVAAAAATNSPTSSSLSTFASTVESGVVPRSQQSSSSSSSSVGKANSTAAVDPAPAILPPLLSSLSS